MREDRYYGKLQVIFDDGKHVYDWGVAPGLELRENVEKLFKETFTMEQYEISVPNIICVNNND